MNTYARKTQDKSKPVVNFVSQKEEAGRSAGQAVDNRPEVFLQRKLQGIANNSAQAQKLNAFRKMADNSLQWTQEAQLKQNIYAQHMAPVQKKENKTGLPDNLKAGVEGLSGYSLDDVKVHYNSAEPAQLNAHAYAQGTDIHVAPGQEKHLAHEAWHVVQQKQGRVKPTMQMKGGVNVDDDDGLEKEADVMGSNAFRYGHVDSFKKMPANNPVDRTTVQMASGQVIQKGLVKLETLPDAPKQYIRINSFAFAKSGELPIASHSYMSCLGVIVHDHEQKLGGLAHIDTDHLDEISEKTELVIKSVGAMISSIKPNSSKNLELNLFGGLGLKGEGEDNFKTFLDGFKKALIGIGFDNSQIHSLLNGEDSARVAVYFPLQGNFYVSSDNSQTEVLKERSFDRQEFDSDDYEDQEDVKDEIREKGKIIVEIEFDQGEEVGQKIH